MRVPIFLTAVLLAGAASSGAWEQDLIVKPGQPFPDLTIEALLSPLDYEALGLAVTKGSLRLSEIPGDLLILEFFNRYCFTCARQAPQLESFLKLQVPAGLGGRVRVLSIGSGNSPKELSEFRIEHKITYPLASDRAFDLYNELGDPGGTPFTAFLLRRGERWLLADSHVGFYGDVEMLARARVLLKGGADAPAASQESAAPPPYPDEEALVSDFLSRLARNPVKAMVLEPKTGVRVYQATAAGKPLGLYGRLAVRTPVCDLCHPIRFLFAFDEAGNLKGFEPIYVTKFGNEPWTETDRAKFASRLAGKKIFEIDFDPDVDAVTSATMSSALIYDEVRRIASMLKEVREQSD